MILEVLILNNWRERLAVMNSDLTGRTMLVLELVAFIAGLIYLKKYRDTPLFWFILFLGYNFINEISAGVYYVLTDAYSTYVFYNTRSLIFISLMYGMYYKMLSIKVLRQFTALFYVVWLVSYIQFIATSNFYRELCLFSNTLGDFLLIVIIVFSLIESIKLSKIVDFGDNFIVYLGVGWLIYLMISLPGNIIVLVGWMRNLKAEGDLVQFFQLIRSLTFAVAGLMYVIFAYGFYRAKSPQLIND